jgi:hypothetical protein
MRRPFRIGQDVVMNSNPTRYGHVTGFDSDGSVMVQWSGTRTITGVNPDNLQGVPHGWAGRRLQEARREPSGDAPKWKQADQEWHRLSAAYQATIEPLKTGMVRVRGEELPRLGLPAPTQGEIVASLHDPRRSNKPVANFLHYPGFGYGEQSGIWLTYYIDPAIVSATETQQVAEAGHVEPMSANAFVDLLTSMKPADRHTSIRFQKSIGGERGGGSVYVNFVNLPPDVGGAGGGAEAENNRASFWIEGFRYDPSVPVDKVKVESSNNVFHRPWRGAPGVPFRAKTGSPAVVAQYLADYLARVVATVPPNFTHTKVAQESIQSNHPDTPWSQTVIEDVAYVMQNLRPGESAKTLLASDMSDWGEPPGVDRETYLAAVRYELRGYLPEHRLMARQMHSSVAVPWTRQNTQINTWFERDRASVVLETLDGQSIIEWWDESVHEAVEDGFLDPHDWHGSAVDYANRVGAKPEGVVREAFRYNTEESRQPARKWAEQTHSIVGVPGDPIQVHAEKGVGGGLVLFTRKEWEAYENADWEQQPDGTITFQGRPTSGRLVKVMPTDGSPLMLPAGPTRRHRAPTHHRISRR